jgi:hypothetical protein
MMVSFYERDLRKAREAAHYLHSSDMQAKMQVVSLDKGPDTTRLSATAFYWAKMVEGLTSDYLHDPIPYQVFLIGENEAARRQNELDKCQASALFEEAWGEPNLECLYRVQIFLYTILEALQLLGSYRMQPRVIGVCRLHGSYLRCVSHCML